MRPKCVPNASLMRPQRVYNANPMRPQSVPYASPMRHLQLCTGSEKQDAGDFQNAGEN